MKDRIFHLRKEVLGKSRAKFGEPIGMTDSEIKNIETGITQLKENKIPLICKEYGVNEDWLRNGTGGDDNMFVVPAVSHDDEIAAFFAKILAEEGETAQKRWAYAYSKLPPELWEQLDKIMQAIIAGYK